MISMQLQGMEALHAQLLELDAQLAVKALAQAARKAFKPVLDQAKSMCPRDSGALADSLKISVTKPKSGDAVVVVGIKIGKTGLGKPGELPPSRRWHFVELGTAKMQAHPFLRPALDGQASNVLGLLKDELQNSIAKALRKK